MNKSIGLALATLVLGTSLTALGAGQGMGGGGGMGGGMGPGSGMGTPGFRYGHH